MTCRENLKFWPEGVLERTFWVFMGKHSMTSSLESSIALERTTWVWLGWLPIWSFLVCGWCCFLFRLSFWSSRCVLYTTTFGPVWRQYTSGGCSRLSSHRCSCVCWCWAVCHIHDSAGGRGWLAPRAEVSVSSIRAKSVPCVVTARSSEWRQDHLNDGKIIWVTARSSEWRQGHLSDGKVIWVAAR